MELPGLILLFVLYTVVVATVVAVIFRMLGRNRRTASEVPIPSPGRLNIEALNKREAPTWPLFNATTADAPTDSAARPRRGIERDMPVVDEPADVPRPSSTPPSRSSGFRPTREIDDPVPDFYAGLLDDGVVGEPVPIVPQPIEPPELRVSPVAVEPPAFERPSEPEARAEAPDPTIVARLGRLTERSYETVEESEESGEAAVALEPQDAETAVGSREPAEVIDHPHPEAVQAVAPVVSVSEPPADALQFDEVEVTTIPLPEIEPVRTLDAIAVAPAPRAELSLVNSLSPIFSGDTLLPEGLRTLEVTPGRVVEPGMLVRAAFTLRNPGGGTATGFRARFNLPVGLVYAVGSARVDEQALDDENGQTGLLGPLGAPIGDIPAGGERRVSLAFTVAETIENGTPILLQAAVASDEVPVIGSNIARLVVRSHPVLENPMTTLTLVPVRAALPGEELELTARVHNSGQSSALDLIVLLPVPANTTFSPYSVTIDGKPYAGALPRSSFGFSRPTIVTPALIPGATVEITYRVRIDTPLEDATRIIAQGTVCSQEVAEFPLGPVTLEIPSSASFEDGETSFRVDCSDEVEPGERLRIALRAKNVGTATARDLTLAIVLPAGMSYTAGSLTVDDAFAPDHGTTPSVIRLGDLGPGRSVDLALTAIVQSPAPNGHQLRVAANVSWSKGERSFARDIVVRSAPRFPADFNRIDRESAQRVSPDDAVSYTIALANMGTDIATAVRIKLTADDGLEALRVRNGNVELPLGEDMSIALDPLEPGVSLLLRVSGRIASIVEDQKQLRLGAELQTAQMPSLQLGSQTHIVESRPKFAVTTSRIIVDSAQALRFKRVSQCRLVLANEGTDRGRDVRVTLILPDELRLEGVDNATREGDVIVFGDIPAGEKREAVVYVRLVGVGAGNEPLLIAARVGGANVVPVGLNPIALATHAEASFAEDAALTSVPAQTVDAGGEVVYTLFVRNSGDGAAKRVVARIATLTNAVYAQGSTTVNGIALQDHGGTSLLLSEAGLQFADVGAGVEIVASWRAIVNMPLPSGATIESAASVHWDDAAGLTVAATPLVARSTSALPIIDPGLTFSVLGAIAARGPK